MNQKEFGELLMRLKKEFPNFVLIVDEGTREIRGIRFPADTRLEQIPEDILFQASQLGLKVHFKT